IPRRYSGISHDAPLLPLGGVACIVLLAATTKPAWRLIGPGPQQQQRRRHKMTRSHGISKLAGSLLVALPLGLTFAPGASAETTITAVMQAPLRSLDPVITTAYVIRNYGYMVYDTLLSIDANGEIPPQMLDNWKVSDDGK